MLLRVLAATTFVLSLGACVQRDYLVANPSADGMTPTDTRCTANISYVASVEVIALRIDPVFTIDERQEILRAIAEWNHALNGHVRLEFIFAVFLADPQRPTGRPCASMPGASCLRAVRRRSASASPGQWRCCSPRPTAAAW